MQKKLIMGLALFTAGILLQVISDRVDIWIIGVLGGILWPVGLVMSVNVLNAHNQKKRRNDSSYDSTEQDKK